MRFNAWQSGSTSFLGVTPQSSGRYTYEGTTAFKRSLARLRGGLRRLNVVDPAEYDEQEYTEAATAVFQAAQVIASQSR